MRPSRRLLVPALAALALAAAVALFSAFWSAHRALSRSQAEIARQDELRFTLQPLDLAAAAAANPGFEPVSAPRSFTSGLAFDGDLYLAGPAGLSIFAPDGTPRHTLRSGIELPVANITAIASATLRGASQPQILLATAGAGLLLLDPQPNAAPSLHQLLPGRADDRDLSALLALPSGDLLLGTRHAGVLLFTGSQLVAAAALNQQAHDITALTAVDSAAYVVGTRNAGLFLVRGGTIQHADSASGLPDNQVEALLVAGSRLFAGTPLGTAQFDLASPGFRPARTLAPGIFSHALALSAGMLRIGTLDEGVQEVALDARPHLRPTALQAAAPAQRIESFLPAPGATWYALAGGSLLARSAAGWTDALPPSAATLADRNISALAFSPAGDLYVGFFDHGLDILPLKNAPIRHLESDSLFCINRLVLDPARGTIAAATANGLVLFDRQGTPRQTLTRRDGLISDHVTDVAFSGGNLTVATPAGLSFLTPHGTDSLYAFQGLVNNHVYTLAADAHLLLAGTLGGLSVLHDQAVDRNLTVANSGLKHNWITALAANPQGGWLIGTYGAGLMTLSADGHHFTPIDLPPGAPHDLVINPNALLVTPERVYAGTLGHGILLLEVRSGRWSLITRGLPSWNVTAFAERAGELYVGSENGLVRIATSKLAAAAGGSL